MRKLLLVVLFLLLAAPVSATTYFVNKSGSDSNGCTNNSTDACLTITRGIAVASAAGSVIQVGSGTYSENVNMNNAGASGNQIVLQGFPVGSKCPLVPDASPPRSPIPVTVSGGNLGANQQINVEVAYVDSGGTTRTTLPSDVNQLLNTTHATTDSSCSGSGHCSVQVPSPVAYVDATGYNVYAAVGSSPGTFFLQNTSGAISIGTTFTFGTAGNPLQTSGTVAPIVSTFGKGDPFGTTPGGMPSPTAIINATSNIILSASYTKIDCFDINQTVQPGTDTTGLTNLDVWDSYIHPPTNHHGIATSPSDGSGSVVTSLTQFPQNVTIENNYIYNAHFPVYMFCQNNCLVQENEFNRPYVKGNLPDGFSWVWGVNVTYNHNFMHGTDALTACQPNMSNCHYDGMFSFANSPPAWGEVLQHFKFTRNIVLGALTTCGQGEDDTSSTYGTYTPEFDWQFINNLCGFDPEPGSSLGAAVDYNANCANFLHNGSVVFEFNTCVMGSVFADHGSQITAFEGNIMMHTDHGNAVAGCTTPFKMLDSASKVLAEGENDFIGNCTIANYTTGGITVGPNDLKNVDPKVVSDPTSDANYFFGPSFAASTFDYHLKSTSPDIGVGPTGTGVTVDLAGLTRPSPPSIGAYEFKGTGTLPSCPTRLSLSTTSTACAIVVASPVPADLIVAAVAAPGSGGTTIASITTDKSESFTHVSAADAVNTTSGINTASEIWHLPSPIGGEAQLNLTLTSGTGTWGIDLLGSASASTVDQTCALNTASGSSTANGCSVTNAQSPDFIVSAGHYDLGFGTVSSPFNVDFSSPGIFVMKASVNTTGTYQTQVTDTGGFSNTYENSTVSFYNASAGACQISTLPTGQDTGSTPLNDATPSQFTTTYTNTGNSLCTISSGPALVSGAHFTLSTTCGATLAINATCTVTLSIKTSVRGWFTDTVTMSDNAAGSPQTFGVQGLVTAIGRGRAKGVF